MALVRCDRHQLQGRTQTYVGHTRPVGFPHTAAVCGNPDCDRPGYVWFSLVEMKRWTAGDTIFELPTNASKIAVEAHGA